MVLIRNHDMIKGFTVLSAMSRWYSGATAKASLQRTEEGACLGSFLLTYLRFENGEGATVIGFITPILKGMISNWRGWSRVDDRFPSCVWEKLRWSTLEPTFRTLAVPLLETAPPKQPFRFPSRSLTLRWIATQFLRDRGSPAESAAIAPLPTGDSV